MSFLDNLKALFPKPQIPQKRYLALAGLVIYVGLKVYVSFTVDPSDDNLPDRFKDIFMHVAMIDHKEPGNEQQLHAESDEQEQFFYGEQG